MSGTDSEMRIAFVGLGHMGEPMAARLSASGFPLCVHDARAEVADRFATAHDVVAAPSVTIAVEQANVLVAMLPDDVAVREVMLGRDGVLASMRSGGVAIDMGTSSPESTILIGAELAKRGIAYIDAPVMGGVPFALDGTLEIMAGGDPDAVERCVPLFNALGRRIWRCGASGSGHALKAIANFANAATLVALIEAMMIGRKFGLESQFIVEAFTAMCAGRQHPLEKKIVPHVMTRRFATGMAMGLIAKDVGIAAELAHSLGARASIADETHAVWQEAAKRYGFARDQSEIARLWEDFAGVEL